MQTQIENYWQLDTRAQNNIKYASRTIAAHGSKAYRVTGKCTCEAVYLCGDCEYCEGHNESITLWVDSFVSSSLDDAIYQAIESALSAEGYNYDYEYDIKWLEGPVIREVVTFGNE